MLTSTPTDHLKLDPKFISHRRIALVVSRFNTEVTESLRQGALKTFVEFGFKPEQIITRWVPGAFEIPFVAKQLAQTKKYHGIVTLGCVIRGDTPHFEYVCQGASMGCMTAALDTNVPMTFGVITVNTPEQACVRSQDNEFNKGREAAIALLDVMQTVEKERWD